MANNEKIYNMVFDSIIERLEKGICPWRKPWVAGSDMPRNLVSKKPYRGINVFTLGMQGYASPFWVSFKQAKALGGQVRKGEKASPVVFWKPLVISEVVDGEREEKRIFFLRYYNVFNVDQCEGISHKVPVVEVPDNFNPIANCEAIVSGMPNAPKIEHGGGRAFYRPPADMIGMPQTETFETPEGYYSTMFHEMAHSTGHKSRLNRDEVTKAVCFGDSDYSLEELVAEMTSAMLCQYAGIGNEVIDNQAAYLQSWLKKLKDDRKMLVQAGGRAQKAFDYILDQTPDYSDKGKGKDKAA
jgi:antirestriction protein ArdC